MPRSDASSDPGDGSITSDEDIADRDRDEQAVGPTSPVQQQSHAPWHSSSPVEMTDANGIQQQQQQRSVRIESIKSRKQTEVSPSRQPREVLPLGAAIQRTVPSSRPLTGPNARFRAAVGKVMRMNKMKSAGESEPGIDPRREGAAALYAHIKERCTISIVDYGPTKHQIRTGLTNEELEKDLLTQEMKRPLWSKVRWYHVGGISWDVIRALALKYDIHPLSIEDVLHGRKTSRSKADYYNKHLFLRILCHTIGEENSGSASTSPLTSTVSNTSSSTTSTAVDGLPSRSNVMTPMRTSSPVHDIEGLGKSMTPTDYQGGSGRQFSIFRRRAKPEEMGIKGLVGSTLSGAQPWGVGDAEGAWAKEDSAFRTRMGRRGTAMSSRFLASPEGQKAIVNQQTVEALKKDERVLVLVRNLYVFMFRDGTFITIHQDNDPSFFAPILNRLRQRDTLLRSTADVSLLLQAVLDLVVDNAVRVVDRYHAQLLKFEKDILIKPKMKTVRYLHIMSGDLTMYKRTLSPLKSLIYGLRRYDLDRSAAQADTLAPDYDEKKIAGFMSHKAKVYLADVMDHTVYILASLEMFETISENLIAYTFNVVAYETNSVMRALTLATVIFLPLTFLTGYFGMNFEIMDSVQKNSELFFWKICIPVFVATIITFTFSDLKRLFYYLQKKAIQKQYQGEMRAQAS